MKIVYLLNHFLPQQVAGTEVYTQALAKSLQQEGHEISIVIPKYDTDKNDEYEYDGLRVVRYAEANKTDRKLIAGKRPPDGIKSFEDIIKSIQPDIVNVQELAGSSGIGIFHLRVLKSLNIKTILTMHLASYSCFCGSLMYKGTEPCDGTILISKCTRCALSKLPANSLLQDILYGLSIPLYNIKINPAFLSNKLGTALSYPYIIKNLSNQLHEIAGLCDKIIVLTGWYKKVLMKNNIPENKLELITQALPHPAEVIRKIKTGKLPLKLIFVGRIDPLKGLHLLIQALMELPVEKIQLDIYGPVTDDAFYKTWKETTSHKTNIQWKGTISQPEVVNTMEKYDMLVLPSIFSEMSPLVIQEAFAAGIPVLGSNAKGITEQIVDGFNGLLFEFGNYKSLKTTLEKIILTPELLPELSSNINPPANFSEAAKKTMEVYKAALDQVTLIN